LRAISVVSSETLRLAKFAGAIWPHLKACPQWNLGPVGDGKMEQPMVVVSTTENFLGYVIKTTSLSESLILKNEIVNAKVFSARHCFGYAFDSINLEF
jgi:hypothetical protein